MVGSNLLIFESFLCLNRGSPFAEWSDSDANNGNQDPGDLPGTNGFHSTLVVLLGSSIGGPASLPPGSLGARSPV